VAINLKSFSGIVFVFYLYVNEKLFILSLDSSLLSEN